jgi:hypothetical protein
MTNDSVRQELLGIAIDYEVLAESVELIGRALKPN